MLTVRELLAKHPTKAQDRLCRYCRLSGMRIRFRPVQIVIRRNLSCCQVCARMSFIEEVLEASQL